MLCKNATVATVALCSLVVLQAAARSGQAEKARLDKHEAKAAFEYLNRVRKDPPSFSKQIGADLKDVKAMPALKWNTTLAKVAEQRLWIWRSGTTSGM